MRLPALLAPLVLSVSITGAVAPQPADASTVNCRVGYYSPGLDQGGPSVSSLRARNLPRRTDGYAPPCLVAETIAGQVQFGASEGDRPARVRVFGARWDGGTWRCSYAGTAASCRKAGKARRRVTFKLGG